MLTANEARVMEKEMEVKVAEELNTKAKEFCDSLDETIKSKVEKREHTAIIETPYEIRYQVVDILEKNGYGTKTLSGGSIEIRW